MFHGGIRFGELLGAAHPCQADPVALDCSADRADKFRDRPAPDVDAFREPSGLTDARDHDDRRDGFTEQEVLILGEEEHLWT